MIETRCVCCCLLVSLSLFLSLRPRAGLQRSSGVPWIGAEAVEPAGPARNDDDDDRRRTTFSTASSIELTQRKQSLSRFPSPVSSLSLPRKLPTARPGTFPVRRRSDGAFRRGNAGDRTGRKEERAEGHKRPMPSSLSSFFSQKPRLPSQKPTTKKQKKQKKKLQAALGLLRHAGRARPRRPALRRRERGRDSRRSGCSSGFCFCPRPSAAAAASFAPEEPSLFPGGEEEEEEVVAVRRFAASCGDRGGGGGGGSSSRAAAAGAFFFPPAFAARPRRLLLLSFVRRPRRR